jgi:hypothetical protein
MTNLLYRNDTFVTVQNKCSKTPPSTSVHFATRALRSRVVRLSWSSRFSTQAAASKMRASNSSVYPTLFCKLRSSSNRTSKNLTELRLYIQTALSRWPFSFSFKYERFTSHTIYLMYVLVHLRSTYHLHNIYRVIQEERPIFWEVILTAIVRKSSYERVSNCEWLPR